HAALAVPPFPSVVDYSGLRERAVTLRPAVAEELPDITHFADQVHVQIGDHNVVLVALADRQHLATRIAEVALAVEFADAPRLLDPRPVDRAHVILVGHRVGGLLQLPQILGQPGHGGRRIEDDLRPVQTEAAGALR